ncbi:virulence factor [Pilibacter termitis]|uniref:Virulence factor n=1 Tax=Pilibacter termitis TaxID=263852 RepID=A0A1T4MSC7_9ENTE|nr:Gfo/Idh/MocA family oxidoreductase [Pilibacter termitis]SJZ69863.1 virulence factor [Pilibacter termitis]
MKKKVAIIGAGGIAQKAYLPVYAQMQNEFEFIISSRMFEKAEKLREQYNFYKAVEGIEPLFSEKIEMVMIHSATSSHFELCEKFLSLGIDVFVDKPISEEYAEVIHLKNLANEKQVRFMAGFNRRFAPMCEKLKEIKEKSYIAITKNRVNQTLELKYGLYDLFIHPLDTALYLLDEEIKTVSSRINEENGQMSQAFLQIETQNTLVHVRMNMRAGANTETFAVESVNGSFQIENLQQFSKNQAGKRTIEEFDDWTPTLEKRGFAPMIRAFLHGENLRQEKTIYSHELIERMIHLHFQNH